MTKTNYLGNIRNVNFPVSSDSDIFLTSILSNEIELLNISGGIPEDGNNDILLSVDFQANQNSLFFSCESEVFTIERELFWTDKFIGNKYLIVFSTGRGIGTFIFINEVIQARKLGMDRLIVSAAKSDRFNGYYTWARLGYSIDCDSQKDLEEFDELMNSYGRTETSIIELMQTKNGRDFWKKNGFWWQGIFDLSDNSENIEALNTYLSETGINLSL